MVLHDTVCMYVYYIVGHLHTAMSFPINENYAYIRMYHCTLFHIFVPLNEENLKVIVSPILPLFRGST